MENIPSPKLLRLLNEIPDCRKGNAIKHKLIDILTIGILAMLCYADTEYSATRVPPIRKKIPLVRKRVPP